MTISNDEESAKRLIDIKNNSNNSNTSDRVTSLNESTNAKRIVTTDFSREEE